MIGDRIKALRLKNGETQDTLAKAVGVTAQAVSKWENNVTTPDISLLVPIADHFWVSTDHLLREQHSSVRRKETENLEKLVSIKQKVEGRGSGNLFTVWLYATNKSDKPMRYVAVKTSFYGEDGKLLDYKDRDFCDLLPGVTKYYFAMSTVVKKIDRVETVVTSVTFEEE